MLSNVLLVPHLLYPGTFPSTQEFNNSQLTKARNILLVESEWFHQKILDKILQTFPQTRDFSRIHGDFDAYAKYAPFFFLLNIIAEAINATLVMPSGFRKICSDAPCNISATDYIMSAGTMYNFTSQFHTSNVKSTFLSLVDDKFNFAYCQHRKRKGDSMSAFGIFGGTADPFVWLFLVLSIIFTSVVVKGEISKEFSLIILGALSVLLSPGAAGLKSTSKLFVIWMFTSLVFVTYYSGSLTSLVTSPSPDLRITKMEELFTNNYSFVVTTPAMRSLLKTKIEGMLTWISDSKSEKYKTLSKLNELLRTSPFQMLANRSWHDWLAGTRKFAFFGYSQEAVHVANSVKGTLKGKYSGEIRCYVGEQLELEENSYLLASSAQVDKLKGIVESFIEVGLKHWLMQELFMMLAFSRVQDRSRSISLTKLVEDLEPAKPLKFSDGKLASVFLLFAFNVTICLLVFVSERLIFSCKIKSKHLIARLIMGIHTFSLLFVFIY